MGATPQEHCLKCGTPFTASRADFTVHCPDCRGRTSAPTAYVAPPIDRHALGLAHGKAGLPRVATSMRDYHRGYDEGMALNPAAPIRVERQHSGTEDGSLFYVVRADGSKFDDDGYLNRDDAEGQLADYQNDPSSWVVADAGNDPGPDARPAAECPRCGYEQSVVCLDNVRACGDCGYYPWPMVTAEADLDDAVAAAENADDDGDLEDCWASFTTGGSDPYGTSCDLKFGHAGPHEGPDPMGGSDRVRWEGGGSCAGDPLPYRNVEWPAVVEGMDRAVAAVAAVTDALVAKPGNWRCITCGADAMTPTNDGTCPTCGDVEIELVPAEVAGVKLGNDEPCDCGGVKGPNGGYLAHAAGGHPDCEATPAVQRAAALGKAHGRATGAAAETSAPYDGPGPLSGEWADEPTPITLARELGLDPESPEAEAAADEFEAAWHVGYVEAAGRVSSEGNGPAGGRLILRGWRDGSVHAAVPTVSLLGDDTHEFVVHFDNGDHRFETACGVKWFGRLSSSGYEDPARVSCPACRSALLGEARS